MRFFLRILSNRFILQIRKLRQNNFEIVKNNSLSPSPCWWKLWILCLIGVGGRFSTQFNSFFCCFTILVQYLCANCFTDFKYNFFFGTEYVSKCGQLRDIKSVTLRNVIYYLEYMSTDCHRQAAQCHNNQNQNHQTAWSRIQNLLPLMCTRVIPSFAV